MKWSLLHFWMSDKLLWICLIKVKTMYSSHLVWAGMKHVYMWYVLIYFTESLVTYHTSWLFP